MINKCQLIDIEEVKLLEIISEISSTAKGLEIRLSRTSDKFLERLFEIEVPEIEDGIIEIKAIARASGDRSKVVVHSSDRRIDAVGACVGMRGVEFNQ